MSFEPSSRSEINAFLAMDVMRKANVAEEKGHRIIHMEVGQPGAPAPQSVIDEAQKWLARGRLGYTDALGLQDLRHALASHYQKRYGVDVDPTQIVVTTGSSGGFNLAFLAAFDRGQKIGLPTPGYPAYRNILAALGLVVVDIETGPEDRWTLSVEALQRAHEEHGLDGVLVASPANPSGTMLTTDALKNICDFCHREEIRFISDEIYHGLVFDGDERTAFEFSKSAIVVNSFSKYYCMTGWRIGWMVLPENLVRSVERLAQNLFISAPELSQRAAIAALEATEELEDIKKGYAKNRLILRDDFTAMGLTDFLPVDGAFYLYLDVGQLTNDTLSFSEKMLNEAGVAATPGADFDPERGHRFMRFSFAGETEDMREAMVRLKKWLA